MTETTKASELAPRPCYNPWCPSHKVPAEDQLYFGVAYTIASHSDGGFVRCHVCRMVGPYCETKAEAIAAWNAPTPLPNEGELVEQMARAMHDGAVGADDHDYDHPANVKSAEYCRDLARDSLTALRPYLNDGKRVAAFKPCVINHAHLNDTEIVLKDCVTIWDRWDEKTEIGLDENGLLVAVRLVDYARQALKQENAK